MKDTRKYWLWMSHMCGQGSRTAVELLKVFKDAEAVYKSDNYEIKKKFPGIDKRVLSRLSYKSLNEEEDILRWCDDSGVNVLTPVNDAFPKSLLSLPDTPMVLYSLGTMPDFDETLCCAVVGTRKMSDYGRDMAQKIGSGIADGGGVIVSGLALGIDGMAMAAALDAGGKCIAVLGCGIDVVYPREHEDLLRKVIENGAVITEYAPGVSPMGPHFPVRNRIISGISQAVCVVEGNMSSGSLITARHALYQGKNLYAVPGPVGSDGSIGTNGLIKDGSRVATTADDILADFEFIYPLTVRVYKNLPHKSAEEIENNYHVSSRRDKTKAAPKKKKQNKENPFHEEKAQMPAVSIDYDSFGDDERTVFDFMKPDVPMLTDEIAKCGLPMSSVMVALTMLELCGAIEAGAGGYYLKRAADCGGDPEYITEDDDGI